MLEIPNLPIVRLSGVIETLGERSACSLVFQLETEAGKVFHLPYGLLMETLRFAEKERVIPPLSPHWWARIGSTDGCTIGESSQ
ncbi:MAG: hypothetical protein PHE17_20050 [Thiothrix sp.]|uniref:hypothetical protein n=1 Tax=Thiothrix sp. TaxID=1032 RepID=UPI002634938E|nr:hypothetical protein [Thiothrix sp.]MDD5395323.1 hypothetical protein [Thiothrix sp.]